VSIEDEIIGSIRSDKSGNYLILILIFMCASIWGSHKIHSEGISDLEDADKVIQESITELRDQAAVFNSDLKLIKWREDHE